MGLGPTTSWPQPVLALSERKGSEGGDPGIRQGRDGQGRMMCGWDAEVRKERLLKEGEAGCGKGGKRGTREAVTGDQLGSSDGAGKEVEGGSENAGAA